MSDVFPSAGSPPQVGILSRSEKETGVPMSDALKGPWQNRMGSSIRP